MDAEKAAHREEQRRAAATAEGREYYPPAWTSQELTKEANRIRSRDLLITRKETTRLWKEHESAKSDIWKEIVAECVELNGEGSDADQRAVASH